MKAKELIYLLNEEAAKVSKEKKGSDTLKFIMRAYGLVAKHLNENFNTNELVTPIKINALHLTKNMKDKLIKLLNKKIVNNSDMKKKLLHNELRRIAGIGPQKANDLIQKGLTSVAQLKHSKWWVQLNLDTQTALSTQPILRIPHTEIKAIEPILTRFIGPETKVILVGSYRRQTATSKDIDAMLVSANPGAMNAYLKYLEKKVPHIYLYSKGADKMSLVLEFDKIRKYKIDVFRTHPDYYWAHMLYATGSKTNNVQMRARAKKMGLLLNQKGLWKNGERLLGPTANEHAYFRALNLEYLSPEKR